MKRTFSISSARTAKKARTNFVLKPATSLHYKKRKSTVSRPELKYVETTWSAIDPGTAGTVLTLNTTVEGSDFNQRIGRKINSVYLEYCFNIGTATAATGLPIQNGTPWVVHIVHDKNPNAGAATAIEVLDSGVVGTAGSPGLVYAFKNKKNGDERFKILKTHYGYYDAGQATSNQASRTDSTFTRDYVSLSGLPGVMSTVQYNSAASVNPISNSIYAVAVVNQAGAININGNFRYVFTD